MADESVSAKKTVLGEKGLAKLVSLVLKELSDGSGGDESKDGYLPLSGGTLTGEVRMGATGFAITAEGHIVLPSGVEIY